jgi:hypothetical protein
MTEKGFTHPRRKFLISSTKILAAALTSVLPGRSRVAQALISDSPAQSPFPTHYYSGRGMSMLTVRPAALGAQLFAHIPRALRSEALQIECVLAGIKPACRLSLTANELQESIAYLKGLNCAYIIEQVPRGKLSYAQMSPQRRLKLNAQPRVRVYLAKSAADAGRLRRLESVEFNYRALGLALGYPECCVLAALKQDQTYFDEAQQVWRQTNLNSAAVQASTAADFRCNHFLVESDLYSAGPLSAIAHYPCRLDCHESIALAQSALERCARAWPIWSIALCELMRSPILYWSDDLWPADYWDEYCGLALVGASPGRDQEWNSVLPAILLGADNTPDGQLPDDVVKIKVVKDRLLLHCANGDVLRLSLRENGHPHIIDWRSGNIEKLA